MEYKKKMKELHVQDALEYTQHIINAVHDPLIILFEDLKVALASRSFYEFFNVTEHDTEGKFIYALGNHQWDIPRLRHLLEDILPKHTSFENFEISHDFPGIGRKSMLVNACRFYLEANRAKLIVLTIKDVTEHKEADGLRKKIADLEAELKKSRNR